MDSSMKLMFVGDLNLGEYYTNFGHGPKSFNLKENGYVFDRVQHIFDQADAIIGNLEAPITKIGDGVRTPEATALRVDPSSAKQLSIAKFSVLQVANNHIVQHTKQGFEEALSILQSNDIKAAGVKGQDPAILDINGKKLAFFAASDVPDNTDKNQQSYQRLDENFLISVEHSISSFDHVFVLLHWGLEESTTPLSYQRSIAARLKRAGVRGIIGTHPHLFYEIEKHTNFVCAFSMGNFVFDLCWDSRLLKTGVLEIEINDDIVESAVWPVTIKKDGALPTPSGEKYTLKNGTNTIYNLGDSIKRQQIKKNIYFWSHILKGDTILKFCFISKKFFRIFKGKKN